MLVPSSRTPDPGFVADVVWALTVMRRSLLLPAISVGLILVGWLLPMDAPVSVVVFPVWCAVTLTIIGWSGVERIWFLRASRGRAIDVSELVPLTRRFVWPFARLGLFALLIFLPFAGLVIGFRLEGVESQVVFATAAVLFDVLFTFVTPALAFTTRSAKEAFAKGIRALGLFWPASAPYAMVPAFTIVALGTVWFAQAPLGVRIVMSAISGLIALAMKGATAAFYLRRVTVGDDGSASLAAPTSAPARPDA